MNTMVSGALTTPMWSASGHEAQRAPVTGGGKSSVEALRPRHVRCLVERTCVQWHLSSRTQD